VPSVRRGRPGSRSRGPGFDALRASDPDVQIFVLGDFNAFYFEEELTSLEAGGRLTNLWRTLPEPARRSYVFEGQAQALDNVLVSPALAEALELKAFNVNAGKLDQASDHNPLLVTISSAVAPDGDPSPDGGTPITPAGLDLPQPPEGLQGLALRDWLRTNWYVGRHRSVGYSAARRAMYSAIDVAADGRVYGVYSGFSQPARNTTFLDPINADPHGCERGPRLRPVRRDRRRDDGELVRCCWNRVQEPLDDALIEPRYPRRGHRTRV
jgi:hypothetical protein